MDHTPVMMKFVLDLAVSTEKNGRLRGGTYIQSQDGAIHMIALNDD